VHIAGVGILNTSWSTQGAPKCSAICRTSHSL